MSDLIIYGFDLSNYTRTARLACAEKGVPHRLSAEGLAGFDFRNPEHLARHPFGRIPVLEHEGRRVFETTAIGRYLDARFDGPEIFPHEPDRAVDVEQWTSAINSYLDRPLVRQTVIPYVFPSGPDGKPDRTTIDAALPEIAFVLAGLEKGLSGGTAETPFFGGRRPMMPDLLLPMVDALFVFPEGPGMLSDKPALRRFHEAFRGRPSYEATIPERFPERLRGAAESTIN